MNFMSHRLTALLLAIALTLSLASSALAEALPTQQLDPLPQATDLLAPSVPSEQAEFLESTDSTDLDTADPSAVTEEAPPLDESADSAEQEAPSAEQASSQAQEDNLDEATAETSAETSAEEQEDGQQAESSQDSSFDFDAVTTTTTEQTETQIVTAATPSFEITSTKNITLSYDDRYDLKSGTCAVVAPSTQVITSYQVKSGKKSNSPDKAVITQKSTQLIATGVGSVTLYIVATKDKDAATALANKKGKTSVKAAQLNVTVKPAPLTIMYLAGQSNMEGSSSATTGAHPENSIACKEGQVYSTYAPSSTARAKLISGISTLTECTSTGAENFVAGSLTGTQSISGLNLVYPLNQLTKNGGGKTGMDSGLAYQWNKLTGEKVWTVNAARGGTSIAGWKKDDIYYSAAVNVFRRAKAVYEAEVAAGHYTKAHQLFFWMQGENLNDQTRTPQKYLSYFKSMYNGMYSALGFEQFGFISTRANEGNDDNATDLNMTVPRIVQYYLAIATEFPTVSMVSNQNELWVSNAGVKSYFSKAYPSGKLTYPLRKNATISTNLPTNLKQVHTDVHYTQVAHNENGLLAAKGLYNVIKNGTNTAKTAQFLDSTGTSAPETISCSLGDSVILVPSATPSYGLKGAVCASDSDSMTYDVKTGSLLASQPNSTVTVTLKNASGEQLDAVQINVGGLPVAKLTSVVNYTNGISINWNKISSATCYTLERKASNETDWIPLSDSITTNSYFDSTVKAGVSYDYRINAYIGSVDLTTEFSDPLSLCRLTEPKLKSIQNGEKAPTLSWSKVTGAQGYYVYRRSGTAGWKKIATVKESATTSYTDTATLSNGTTYFYTVRAYQGSSTSSYNSKGLSIVYLPRPTISTIKNASSKKMTLTWSKNTKASGYLLRYSTDKSFASGVKTVVISKSSTLSKTISSLTKKKTYYVQLATYKTVDGQRVCSTWSPTKSIVIKK